MKKKFLQIITIVLFTILLNNICFAATDINSVNFNLNNAKDVLTGAGNDLGYKPISGDDAAIRLIGDAIQIILSFLGIIFLILVIMGGIEWMTAGGNDDAIKKSKTRIKNASIGLAITLGAYAFVYFVLDIILQQTLQ